ncbi:MAG: DNA polymerase I [Candidatus Doudnabacteria bacterium RIFCSPHIGHO2_01_FULL_43_23]|uniref:DNA polymerase I n=1 Tax=Candidatus Doudnabacteria bacterium RIFCSPHIGHO2_01_FULL_43_23 TaxID=1817822 RepID=A0A1F5NRU4_9BACT|nr:MAG: DNA polymerase I [Candidatus Doudnabacteria bacterium RIFCSPHIGHO2_01_FULL_43_23]
MPKEKSKKLMIVDGNSLIHRGFHAIPHLSTSKGEPSNGVYGFVTIFFNALKKIEPDYIAVAFDVPGGTFRNRMYPGYKAKRVKAPQELYDQIPKVKEFVKSLGLPIFEKPDYEADDLIGTIVKHDQDGIKNIIVTGDMDSLQLVDDHTTVFTTIKGLTEVKEYDSDAVLLRYGFGPEYVVDYKALRGDPSDNIPGVAGIGEKGATELIKKFGHIEELYKQLEAESSKAGRLPQTLKAKLLAHKKDAILSKKLATINTNSPIEFDLANTEFGNYDVAAALNFMKSMEFKSLLDKLPKPNGAKKKNIEQIDPSAKVSLSKHYHLIKTQAELDSLVRALKKQKGFAVDTETTSQKEMEAELLGISVSYKKGEAYYIPATPPTPPLIKGGKGGVYPLFSKEGGGGRSASLDLADLKKVLMDKKIEKYGHNMKYDYLVLNLAGIELEPLSFDTMIAVYLLNPGSRGYGLDDQVFRRFGYQMMPIEALIGKGAKQINLSQVPIEQVSQYACEDADYTFQLFETLSKEIKKEKLDKLFYDIDNPLVPVLGLMEKNGIILDSATLNRMAKHVEKDLIALEDKIHKLGKGKFNIASPQQLKEILFTKLELSTVDIKKGKTGLSTAASELEKMKDRHPIIPLLLEYRELAKLKNTYLDALPGLVNGKTGRIHTSYNQTIAATGRLSSVDPNLQNIPIRSEVGNKIREGFVAESGYELLSLDYSQIELRVVAHLSGDKTMKKIFKEGKDIHTATAMEIFEKNESEIDKDDRRYAKVVNFGVLYGLSAYGLTQQVPGITRERAQAFIDKYFLAYQGVSKYLKEIVQTAREKGYVENPLGRRRHLPELNSSQFQVRAAAERAAINMPIQSLAADIIKVAMLDVARKIGVENPECRMLLQVHDELLFEVKTDKVREYAVKIKKLMEQSIELSVPVIVEAKVGKNWGEMEEMRL